MKMRLMEILVCPACRSPFELTVAEERRLRYPDGWLATVKRALPADNSKSDEELRDAYEKDVVSGTLTCLGCAATYPIDRGVPRLLSATMRTQAGRLGRGDPRRDPRLAGFKDNVAPIASSDKRFEEIQMANQSHYGYEWQAFFAEYEAWDTIWSTRLVLEPPEFFVGKLGLDAGCGMARYTRAPLRRGAEMVGLDLSNAVDAAWDNGYMLPMFHIVQGDIFNLPFAPDTFDFAQSLGVIHVTPEPEEALQSIMARVRPKGKVFLYVYPSFEEDRFKYELLKVATAVRRVTVKLPSNVLYWSLYLLMPVVYLGFYLPSRVLSAFPATKKLADRLPYNYDQFGIRRLRDIHLNLFDRFGNPVERRYTRPEIEDWMARSGLQDVDIELRWGWHMTGTVQG